MADPNIVLGIDLGTTNSACAVVQDGRASVVRRGEDRIVPSVVAALPNGQLVVGLEAKRQRAIHPSQVVYSAKRLIGRRFSSPEVQRMMRSVPYRIMEGDNETVMIEVGGRRMSVVELSAVILRYLREMAEEALGCRVKKTVIAVPANFTDSQRSATRIAARLAGLDVIRVINEPTAAALAYGYIEDMDRRIAVYDFGGGTFDVTILQITRNVFEVLSTSGEMFLGGDDVDDAVLEAMVEAYQKQHGVDLRHDPRALEQLRVVAEQVKIQLSDHPQTSLRVDDVPAGSDRDLEFAMTAEELRTIAEPIIGRTVGVCEDAMRVAGLSPSQIDEIVLVGGTTRLPLVRELVQSFFGKAPQTSINPMSVVAVGAAIQGAALLGSLVPMASGGVSMPTMAQTAVLLDVTPRSLGVGTIGGNVDFIIERNSVIPVERTRLFTTTADKQRYVRIQVCQGESPRFEENTKLGELMLSGLREAPRGAVTVAVTFEINTDGLLEVRALDQDTGQEQVATMRVLGGLPQAEVDAIIARTQNSFNTDGSVASRL
ncbi:Hsp70 family protein [Pseudenhygromyxa sp. WMMC2535]|uniref:Hsp70 family protein n=1 Tax=Pseudenhygromyxa sp. WMMC2535 TaxID=2712867 RepID=UPI00155587A0|nr:Hsp70 family protein [Pseudenhygromyxa sp. WMMC2535]NVB39097.1 Hsp70 family protein [Pseudenhygromyxa sp. WMMC2535]